MAIKKLGWIVVIIITKLITWETSAQSLLTDSFDHPIPLDSTVRHGTLDNGFTYYIKKTQGPGKEVYMKLAVKAGSFFETRSQEGYAHLLEHVALNNKNSMDLKSMMKNAGMFTRGQTGQIVTKYQLTIPNANKEKIVLGMDALKSWGGKITFDEFQVHVQRGAVLGEMRTKDPYRDWLNKRYGKILMQNVEFPMNSDERVIKNIKDLNLDALKEFYNDWYRPDMQAAIIVGDIDLDSIQSLVEKNFLDLKNQDDRKDYEDILRRFSIQLEGSNQYEAFKDSVDTGRRLTMFIKEKNYDYNKISERDHYHMFLQKMVNYIVQKRSQEFQKQYDAPFSKYITNHTASNRFNNQVLVSAIEVNLNGIPLAIDKKISAALTAYKSLFSKITNQEVQEARIALESELTRAYQNNFDLAEAYLENFIRGSAVPSPTRQGKLHNLLSEIKVSEVQRFADKKSNLLKNKDFVFVNIPKGHLPGRKKMNDIAQHISGKAIFFNPPILEMELPDSIVNFRHVDSTVNEHSTNLIGITRVKLNNDIEVWLKPSKPRSSEFKNQIELLGFRPMATGRTNKNITPEIMAHSYASYAGAAGFNKFQVAQYLEKHNLKLHFAADDHDFLIEGKFKEKNLEDFFNLLFLKIQEPDKDTAAFSSWKEKEKTLNSVRGGSDFFRDEINKLWYPDFTLFSEEILDTISQDLLLRKYKKHFADFKNYTFILTGDFNSETLLKQVKKYFAKLPVSGQEGYLQPVSRKFDLRKRNDTIRLKNLDQAFAEIYYPVKVPIDIKSQAILDIVTLALNERINVRLRIGSYSPRASGYWIDKKNNIYTLFVNFDSELGHEQNMIEYAEEEFMKLHKTGVDQDWLDATINLLINKHNQAINGFGYFNFWPEYLKEAIKNKEDPQDWILQYPSLLKNFISLEEVNEAIRNYLSVKNQQTFLVLPEEMVQ